MKINHLISINMLPELLKHDYLFIDLREPYQYKQLHLTKFINIPYQDFTINKLDCPKNKPIFLICYSGKRSSDLALNLIALGYQAYSFDGGFYAIEHPIDSSYF